MKFKRTPIDAHSTKQSLGLGQFCGLSTASEVFLNLYCRTIPIFFFFLFALFSEEPEVFLPYYSQTAILHAAHFQMVVKLNITDEN